MANPRALAPALLFVSLAAVSAMFACNGPATDPYEAMTDVGSAVQPPAPDATPSSTTDAAAMQRDVVGSIDWDAASYPLSRCAAGNDVFYLDVTGPSGPLQSGEINKTDAGTYWFVALQPELNVMLASPTGPVGSIQVWTSDSSPVAPGTYAQGPTAKGAQIDVVVINQPCHLSSGTLTVLDLNYDWPDGSTMGDVNSLLLSFDLMCDQNPLRGCVRYAK
jgi:hypothetical protein